MRANDEAGCLVVRTLTILTRMCIFAATGLAALMSAVRLISTGPALKQESFFS
jgi:hypothetical protein